MLAEYKDRDDISQVCKKVKEYYSYCKIPKNINEFDPISQNILKRLEKNEIKLTIEITESEKNKEIFFFNNKNFIDIPAFSICINNQNNDNDKNNDDNENNNDDNDDDINIEYKKLYIDEIEEKGHIKNYNKFEEKGKHKILLEFEKTKVVSLKKMF